MIDTDLYDILQNALCLSETEAIDKLQLRKLGM